MFAYHVVTERPMYIGQHKEGIVNMEGVVE